MHDQQRMFRQGRSVALDSMDAEVQVFPRNATQPPRLLQVLERLLRDGMWEAVLEASAPPSAPRTPGVAANLRLVVHSAVFEEFIGGFESYAPLLREIKDELDGMLDDSVRCARENVELQRQLAQAEAQKEKAVENAYVKAAAAAAHLRCVTQPEVCYVVL